MDENLQLAMILLQIASNVVMIIIQYALIVLLAMDSLKGEVAQNILVQIVMSVFNPIMFVNCMKLAME